ncbi:TniB family NTP-binding protein [Iodobacter fluviatilis]|uniref:TniB protein n=1 Tax=Iodobacter fluviatilis TaxID=537 RepID=A0A377SU12_9NEIS|nr:TniB family NTP-binding protein [Iodobacter fluviatilis]TCU81622.1 TniB protein [Iodobacter fluviatilis]STR44778.1 Uncharacterised protein [Iodobacter fluviatilis]
MQQESTSDLLSPKPKQMWLGKPLALRLQYMNDSMFVPHPQLARTVTAISNKMNYCKQAKKGRAIFVEAPSGCGKTTLTRIFKAQMPTEILDEKTIVPIVYFSVPKVITRKGMDKSLLKALGDPKEAAGTHFDLDERAINLLKQTETKIIFIDNIQDIPSKRREGGIIEIGNWIRDLIDDSAALVVLLGTQDANAILVPNIQLRRRCPGKLMMHYFDINTESSALEFKNFLRLIDNFLPINGISGLSLKEISIPLAYASGGIQDYIFQILSCAVKYAVTQKREQLEITDLAKGFDETFQEYGKEINPFLGQVSRLLNQKGEPLYGVLNATQNTEK